MGRPVIHVPSLEEMSAMFAEQQRKRSMAIYKDGCMTINPHFEPVRTVAVAGRTCSYCGSLVLGDRCHNCGAPQ